MKIKFPPLLIISALCLCIVIWLIGLPVFTPLVTIAGITFLVAVSLVTYGFAIRTINDPNPNKFVRTVMAMTMIKFFVCAIAAFILIAILQKQLNKPDLYLLMGVYLIYSIMESIFLSQEARNNKQ